MKITKELEYKMYLTLKPYWTEGLSFDNIWDEKQLKVTKIWNCIWLSELVDIWILSKREFNCIKTKSLN